MTGDPVDPEDLRRFADSLSFVTDDDLIDACLDRLMEMPSVEDTHGEGEGEHVGVVADDEYGALLERYPEPRTGNGGDLDGLALAVKDNVAIEGLAMTCGLEGFSFVPSYDAVAVERLLDAGGRIVGKANMDAMAIGPGGAFSEHGRVRNPAYGDRYPGGSSSGSAAAVAGGLVDAALGTDTGGSVRKPAAYCGVVGMKPTHGLVPRHGVVPLAPSMDDVGALAPDVRTAARVLDAIAGPDPRDPTASHVDVDLLGGLDDADGLSVGIPTPFMECAVEPVREAIRGIADRLEREHGLESREVALDHSPLAEAYHHVSDTEFAWTIRQAGSPRGAGAWYDEGWRAAFEAIRERGLTRHITARKLAAAYVDERTNGRAYVAARREAIEFHRRMDDVFETVDVLLSPTVPRFPPRVSVDVEADPHDRSINQRPFNMTGAPAIAVPAGEVEGLPVSAQVAAPKFEDGRAIRVARLIETVRERPAT